MNPDIPLYFQFREEEVLLIKKLNENDWVRFNTQKYERGT